MNILLYTSRINWRLLLVHFIACWFFIYAFRILAYLTDTRLIYFIRSVRSAAVSKALTEQGVTGADLNFYQLWIAISGYVGLVIAIIISLIISKKKGWFWMNAILLLNITYLLLRFTDMGRPYLAKVFTFLGRLTNDPIWEFSINGAVLLALGIFVFFYPKFNQFIDNNNQAEASTSEAY